MNRCQWIVPETSPKTSIFLGSDLSLIRTIIRSRIQVIHWAGRRSGVTMIELITVMAVIGTVVSLALSGVQNAREAARRVQCGSQVRQIGLAAHHYHDTFKQLPVHGNGTGMDLQTVCLQSYSARTSQLERSVFVALLPFLEQQALWEQINHPLNTDADGNRPPANPALLGGPFPAGGPAPSAGRYDYGPWSTELAVLRCPSDPGSGVPAVGRTNYAACIGDNAMFSWFGMANFTKGHTEPPPPWVVEGVRRYSRGAFVVRDRTTFAGLQDGLSQTVLFSEIITDLGDNDFRSTASFGQGQSNDNAPGPSTCRQSGQLSLLVPGRWAGPMPDSIGPAPDPWPALYGRTARRGFLWASHASLFTSFVTTLPPNSELCLAKFNEWTEGNFSASSQHPGGVHVATADGAVAFISDSIDSGDSNFPSGQIKAGQESPYGLWGALGTRGSQEAAYLPDGTF